MQEKIYFIVNRTAGSGSCNEKFNKAEQILNEKGIIYEVLDSEYAGHAIKLTHEAMDKGAAIVVAVGGDGTVNEVSSELCGKKNVKFGVLPFGTGNDFAGAIGIESDAEKAVNVLLNGTSHALDMGIAQELYGERKQRKFINIAGQGFDVEVLKNTEKYKEGRSDMLPYFLGIMDSVLKKKIIKIKLVCNEVKNEINSLLTVISNGKNFGGGIKISPDSKLDDGLFDVCCIENVSLLKFIFLLPFVIKGKHLNFKPVHHYKASNVRIESDEHYEIEIDGEIALKTPVEYKILPGALNVIRMEQG